MRLICYGGYKKVGLQRENLVVVGNFWGLLSSVMELGSYSGWRGEGFTRKIIYTACRYVMYINRSVYRKSLRF